MENVIKYWKEEEGYDTFYNEHGFCAYFYDDETKEFFVGHCYINDNERCRGYGKELFKIVTKIALDLGAVNLTGNLWKTEANKGSFELKVSIFKNLGFKIVSQNDVVTTIIRPVREA